MTFEEIRAAIEGRLAGWPDAPVAYDNVAAGTGVTNAQRNKSPWVRVTIVPGDTLTAAIGDGPKARHTGMLVLQIFTAERKGSAPAFRLADSLANHIQYWQDGKLETQAASLTRVGARDGWFQVNVSAPYRAD